MIFAVATDPARIGPSNAKIPRHWFAQDHHACSQRDGRVDVGDDRRLCRADFRIKAKNTMNASAVQMTESANESPQAPARRGISRGQAVTASGRHTTAAPALQRSRQDRHRGQVAGGDERSCRVTATNGTSITGQALPPVPGAASTATPANPMARPVIWTMSNCCSPPVNRSRARR